MNESASASFEVDGARFYLAGKLRAMTHDRAATEIAARGGVCVAQASEADWIVAADGAAALDALSLPDDWPGDLLPETELWARLGLLDAGRDVRRLYTPTMLADLVGVPVSVVRKWRRRGLISPSEVVHRLEYFDFAEVAAARKLTELMASGLSPRQIRDRLRKLALQYPDVERPLTQLAVIVRDHELLLRRGEGLAEVHGQLLFDYQENESCEQPVAGAVGPDAAATAQDLVENAEDLEDSGDFLAALDAYRASALAAGPDAELCFRMAELLYLIGELPAARERYLTAIELDDGFAEARGGLGLVLLEMGAADLAAEAFRGAVELCPEYPDAHYHLANCCESLGDAGTARKHWLEFLALAPESPWADQIRGKLSVEGQA